jgi:hypothetical protein
MLRINSSVSSGRSGRTVHTMEHAVQADDGRCVDTDMQVSSAFGHHELQQIGHRVGHNLNRRSIRSQILA